MSSLMPTYRPLPVAFQRGEGAYLYDSQNRRYLDGVSGIAVTNLGHTHPAVTEAVCEQMHTLTHTSNLYRIAPQEMLGTLLTSATGMEQVFFVTPVPRVTKPLLSWLGDMATSAVSTYPILLCSMRLSMGARWVRSRPQATKRYSKLLSRCSPALCVPPKMTLQRFMLLRNAIPMWWRFYLSLYKVRAVFAN